MMKPIKLAPLSLLLFAAAPAHAQGTQEMVRTLPEEAIRTVVWMAIATILMLFAYKIADLITPGDLKKQLAEGNTALAIFTGSLIIGFALIIAALVS